MEFTTFSAIFITKIDNYKNPRSQFTAICVLLAYVIWVTLLNRGEKQDTVIQNFLYSLD